MRQPILYTLLFVMLTASGCSFIANANVDSEKQDSDRPAIFDVTIETEIDEYDEYHITIHYPQTPNNQIDQTLVDYVNRQKAKFKQESYQSKQQSGEDYSHELHIDFEVVHQNTRFFVVRFIETMDIGKEELVTNQTIMNFDKKTGKPVEVEELFKDDVYYVDQLHTWILEKLEGTEGDGRELRSQLKATPQHYENIAFSAEGLNVYLDAENLNPMMILVERDEILPLLRAEYADALEDPPIEEAVSQSEEKREKVWVVESADSHFNETTKKVALTFDDGPHPTVTRSILDILDQYGAKASFFMIGKRVSYYPDVAQEVSERGHEIGNHTWDHSRMSRLAPEEVEQQMTSTQMLIEQVTGQKAELVRLPFGDYPPFTARGNLEQVPWTIYSEEWTEKEPLIVAQEILSQIEDESIILLHDLDRSTVETVEILLKRLEKRDYQFVPVSEIGK